ncbi:MULTISPECIES: hypothetical protein [unclassified Pseudomonas]|uniref:hypothetical protein n=1 Tax=unclassified Pseudomonas TaxID=196821 RepID=UPI000A1FF7E7|nr:MULTISPECIES: hypothetical protein [unclassified Pseudomonas]
MISNTLKSWIDCRRISSLLLLTGLASLSGCHQLTTDQRLNAYAESGGKSAPMFMTSKEIRAMEARSYIRVLRRTLSNSVFLANDKGMQGSVKLRMKLSRQGDVLLCEAQSTDPGAPPDFANLVTDVCWSEIWSTIPEDLQSPADGSLEIIAPLIAKDDVSPISDYSLTRRKAGLESRFFWDNVLARHSINAFGSAHFDFTANAKGQVTRCDVTLEKSYSRPESFHPDTALQKALAAQCLQLDLQHMPGFQVGESGVINRSVFVKYFPWKNHVGKHQEKAQATDKKEPASLNTSKERT